MSDPRFIWLCNLSLLASSGFNLLLTASCLNIEAQWVPLLVFHVSLIEIDAIHFNEIVRDFFFLVKVLSAFL
jgi:hypothetical protein